MMIVKEVETELDIFNNFVELLATSKIVVLNGLSKLDIEELIEVANTARDEEWFDTSNSLDRLDTEGDGADG